MADASKYIWIVGDIHGMYDPLKEMILHLKTKPVEELLFVGDYVDRGPSSKEVLDFLMDLPQKTTFLMGNHEQMMYEALFNSNALNAYTAWEYNGGKKTVESFGWKDMQDFKKNIDQKYIHFLKNLRIATTRSFQCQDLSLDFLFTHAGIVPGIPVEVQKNWANYAELIDYYQNNNFEIYDSPLWVRNNFLEGDPDFWANYIVVHGHTPTQILSRILKDLPDRSVEKTGDKPSYKAYMPDLPFLRKHPGKEKVVSIGIDTWIASLMRLTAIGLSEANIDHQRQTMRVEVVQVSPSTGGYGIESLLETSFELDFNKQNS